MKLGKIIDEAVILVECEDGKEVNGSRTEEELYAEGYKKACLTERPSKEATERWEEYPTCLVQFWDEQMEEPEE